MKSFIKVEKESPSFCKAGTLILTGNGSVILLTEDYHKDVDGNYFVGTVLFSDYNPIAVGTNKRHRSSKGYSIFTGQLVLSN